VRIHTWQQETPTWFLRWCSLMINGMFLVEASLNESPSILPTWKFVNKVCFLQNSGACHNSRA